MPPEITTPDWEQKNIPMDQAEQIKMVYACSAGDVKLVSSLLDQGHVSPDYKQPNGLSLLMVAAREGHVDVCRMLLDRGAHIDTTGMKAAGTSMMQATEHGHADVVSLLLERGADPDSRDPAKNTAIFYAASNNDIPMMKTLHTFGAGVNSKNMNNHTALHSAAREGHPEACTWLIDHGCKINTPNVRQWSPLHVAVLKAKKGAVRVLLSRGGACCLGCVKCNQYIKLYEKFGNMGAAGDKKPADAPQVEAEPSPTSSATPPPAVAAAAAAGGVAAAPADKAEQVEKASAAEPPPTEKAPAAPKPGCAKAAVADLIAGAPGAAPAAEPAAAAAAEDDDTKFKVELEGFQRSTTAGNRKQWLKPENTHSFVVKGQVLPSKKKIFFNVVHSPDIGSPFLEPREGLSQGAWVIPCMFAEPRKDKDKSGKVVIAVDCCVQAAAIEMGRLDTQFRERFIKAVLSGGQSFCKQIDQPRMISPDYHVLVGVTYKSGTPAGQNFVRLSISSAEEEMSEEERSKLLPVEALSRPYPRALQLAGDEKFDASFRRAWASNHEAAWSGHRLKQQQLLDLEEETAQLEALVDQLRMRVGSGGKEGNGKEAQKAVSRADKALSALRAASSALLQEGSSATAGGALFAPAEHAALVAARKASSSPLPPLSIELVKGTKLEASLEARRSGRFAREKAALVELQSKLAEDEEALSKCVRGKHRRLALQLHPDKLKRARTAEDERNFEMLTEAYKVLENQASRMAYLRSEGHAEYVTARAVEMEKLVEEDKAQEGEREAAKVKTQEVERQKQIDAHWEKKNKGVAVDAAEEDRMFEMLQEAQHLGGAGAGGGGGGGGGGKGAAKKGTAQATAQARAKLKGGKLTEAERKLWELTIRDQKAQQEQSSKLKRLTCGEPNKCTMPRVVQEEAVKPTAAAKKRGKARGATESQQGMGRTTFKLHLQWRCKFGSFTTGRPERYELQQRETGGRKGAEEGEFVHVYEGEESSFCTPALPDGHYLFRARAVNANGGGMWSDVNDVHLDSYQQSAEREVKYMQAREALAVEQTDMARYHLREALRDFKCSGIVRSVKRREEMCRDLIEAVKKAQLALFAKSDDLKDVQLLKDGMQTVQLLREKDKLQKKTREQRVDVRLKVELALQSFRGADAFAMWVKSLVPYESEEASGGGGGGGGDSDGEEAAPSITPSERNMLFQFVTRAACKGKSYRTHEGRMKIVMEALAARDDLFSKVGGVVVQAPALYLLSTSAAHPVL